MTGIWFINRGKFKVHKQWGEDKELIVRLARDGDIVGHRGMGSDNVILSRPQRWKLRMYVL